MTLKNELLRKSIHLLLLVIPLAIRMLSRGEMLTILGTLLFVAAAVELLRRYNARFGRLFLAVTGTMLREHEKEHLTGATYLLLSSFVCVLVFSSWIAQVALLFVVVSDGLSALAGKFWGKHPWIGGKTWEGNAVFILTAVAIVLLHPDCPSAVGLAGGAAAFVCDVFITGIDDNLTIPLCSGVMMQVISVLM
ncbi:hypothetical protein JXO52_16540 [bacterium]|nr:hypothetical protein [bacterium]